jgi:hypothetical protein
VSRKSTRHVARQGPHGGAAPTATADCDRGGRHGRLVAYGAPVSLPEPAFHHRRPRSIQRAMYYNGMTPLTRLRPRPQPTSRMVRMRSWRLPTTDRSVRFRVHAPPPQIPASAPIRTPRLLVDFSPAPADRAGPAPDNTTPLRANRAPRASSRRSASDARQRNDCRPPPACA